MATNNNVTGSYCLWK